MIAQNISYTAIEETSHKNLFFFQFTEEMESGWGYILVDNNLLPIFSSLKKFLPLKINLNDYGTIICSGEGSEPPLNIRKQIENGDFSNQSGGKPKIYCLFSKDNNGRDFFTYLEVPFYLEQKVEGIIRKKSLINFEEYGRIIESGWGAPSREVIDKMYREYGATTPSLEHS